MQITYLKTIGFRKFKEEFSTNLYNTTSITGGNTKGKTNILYAIIWGFLGTNLTGDDKVYIGNKNADNCYVEIHFIDNLGTNHVLKRLKNKYNNKKNFLLLDDKQINQDELTSYYSDKKLFLSIVNSNYFISRSPTEQKNLLDKYLPNIDISKIYEKLDDYEKSILEYCPQDILTYIKELNDNKKMYDDKIKNLQGKIAYAENFTNSPIEEPRQFTNQDELSLAMQNLSFLTSNQLSIEKEKQYKIVETINNQITTYQNQINTLNTNLTNLKKSYFSLKDRPIAHCPTCNQELSDVGKSLTLQKLKIDLENDYSNKLVAEFGKKYNERTLRRIRQYYRIFKDEKRSPLATKLSWSHYSELLSIKDENELIYYINIAYERNLSKRELREIIRNKEYERLPNETKNKLMLADEIEVKDLVPNPIIIRNKNNIEIVTEKVLHNLILEDIESFMRELGNSFSFIGSEYKIKIGDRNHYIDLLLFNIKFNCYVVIELKVTQFKVEYISQVQKYMNYIDKNIKEISNNNTMGILICKRENKFVIEYCSDERIVVREYELV